MVASTLSQDPLEDVAAEFGETPGQGCDHHIAGGGGPGYHTDHDAKRVSALPAVARGDQGQWGIALAPVALTDVTWTG